MATADAGDEDMRQRIQKHKESRPPSWSTLETTTDIARQIPEKAGDAGVIIIDCITLLVNNIFRKFNYQAGEQSGESPVGKEITRELDELIECMNRLDADFIIVTNEVGMDLVPANHTGRLYRDWLGRANQQLAGHADRVYLMVSGIPVQIKPDRNS